MFAGSDSLLLRKVSTKIVNLIFTSRTNFTQRRQAMSASSKYTIVIRSMKDQVSKEPIFPIINFHRILLRGMKNLFKDHINLQIVFFAFDRKKGLAPDRSMISEYTGRKDIPDNVSTAHTYATMNTLKNEYSTPKHIPGNAHPYASIE